MSEHPSLFDWKPRFGSDFDGATFEPRRDGSRLNKQLTAVYSVMEDGHWYLLSELSELAHAPEASVSARMRDLRKPKFGGHIIEREYLGNGLFRYRLKANDRRTAFAVI